MKTLFNINAAIISDRTLVRNASTEDIISAIKERRILAASQKPHFIKYPKNNKSVCTLYNSVGIIIATDTSVPQNVEVLKVVQRHQMRFSNDYYGNTRFLEEVLCSRMGWKVFTDPRACKFAPEETIQKLASI